MVRSRIYFQFQTFCFAAIVSLVFVQCSSSSKSVPEPDPNPGGGGTGGGGAAPTFNAWTAVNPTNSCVPRHENGFAAAGGKFYLVGGRDTKPVEEYNPATNSWKQLATSPVELNHFQALVYNNEIYVAGAFNGSYPHETPVPDMYIYNPSNNQWRKGASIPAGRRRGAAGAFMYSNKMYLICGIVDGHSSGHVNWFDEYNPSTGAWKAMPNAPRARDHFQAVVIGSKLYLAGGRRSSVATTPEVDVFDFATGTWSTLASDKNIPTQRAGCAAVGIDNKVIVIGGESDQTVAHNQTEAFDISQNKWISLPNLKTGRHGTQAIIHNNQIYIVAGSGNAGGAPELNSMEVLK